MISFIFGVAIGIVGGALLLGIVTNGSTWDE